MIRNLTVSFSLLLLLTTSTQAEKPAGQLIFPLQDIHNHSSSIIQCPNGDLLACWYHGSGERWADDVLIQGARSTDGGNTWSEVFTMADSTDMPDCNPVLFIDAKNRLWLFWAHVMANRWEHSVLRYRRAENYQDAGPPQWSWQDTIVLKPGEKFPDEIRAGFKAMGFEQGGWAEYARAYDDLLVEAAHDPIKRQTGWMPRNHLTVLPSGRILLPLYSDGFNISLTAISDDLGETWYASKPMVGLGPTQPTIVRRNSGQLVAYYRDEGGQAQRVQIATSDDDGITWTHSTDTDIPNPSGSMEVIRLADSHWVMIYNDSEDSRNTLAVALSTDEGTSWDKPRHLEQYVNGSYGYPSIIQTADGIIHATYTYTVHDKAESGESIKHVSFDKSWLTQE